MSRVRREGKFGIEDLTGWIHNKLNPPKPKVYQDNVGIKIVFMIPEKYSSGVHVVKPDGKEEMWCGKRIKPSLLDRIKGKGWVEYITRDGNLNQIGKYHIDTEAGAAYEFKVYPYPKYPGGF